MRQSDSPPVVLPLIPSVYILTFLKRKAGIAEPFKWENSEFKCNKSDFLFSEGKRSYPQLHNEVNTILQQG
ncbi:hypothetical protein SNR26_04685 [Pectobacterium brasiliense]|uniref:hypothetical protein n=1 Tax=Pectobacterium brasiliense TaxID=180957 RepID=UPI002A83B92A|nr:hypothetical protein [Pectobacterium brasiliense]MDY4366856.1 hypothetical protein [Pectobacterium brasiliense]MDY7056543.1 hypothetical protein [Pectobacterium brasiliense]